MDPILEAAGERGIPVIEDACQAIGATYGGGTSGGDGAEGRRAGSMGLAGCFSFFPSKNLGGAGDGGMITTSDSKLAEDLRRLRNHGGRERYYHDEVGINSRLDALQAVVLLVKLRHLDSWSDGRIANAARYGELLAGVGEVTLPVVENGNRHIYNQFVIRAKDRDGLKAFLQKSDIGCEIYYPVPLHLQKCFEFLGGSRGDCPESEKAALETLALPIFTELTPGMQEYVAEKIAGFYG
jgi:dTDP-4-amino-4,6-dideoxygalactose transaminase